MASTTVAQLFVLGRLAAARGKLGRTHSKATDSQMATARNIATDPHSYGRVGTTVICVEDRLHRPDPRLAGGALSLALMRNFLYHGSLLSGDLRELRALGFHLAFHMDCGALGLVAKGFIQRELASTNAEGYKVLEALGYNVPVEIRKRIAKWAQQLPDNYVDLEAAMAAADQIDQITGQHNAVLAAVSKEPGVSFTGGPRLKHETGGLLAFAFDPWVARLSARQIGVTRGEQAAAEALAQVFTAQVFLTLGGRDLLVAVHD